MKKVKISLFLAVFFAFVSFVPISHAATIDDSIALQTQYQNALVELIGLLQQQLVLLEAQLQTVQNSQATLQQTQQSQGTQIQQVVTNTTPTPSPSPVFGNVPDQSALILYHQDFAPHGGTYPFGVWSFDFVVSDATGNKTTAQNVVMTGVNNNLYPSVSESGTIQYVASTSPIYPITLTFTSGNLSTTTIINIQ